MVKGVGCHVTYWSDTPFLIYQIGKQMASVRFPKMDTLLQNENFITEKEPYIEKTKRKKEVTVSLHHNNHTCLGKSGN